MDEYFILYSPKFEIMEEYYNIAERYSLAKGDRKKLFALKEELIELSKKDGYYFDPVNLLSIIYYIDLGMKEEAKKILEESYSKIENLLKESKKRRKRVKLDYLIIENRHIFRLMDTYGLFLLSDKEFSKALKVYKKIYSIDMRDAFEAKERIEELKPLV